MWREKLLLLVLVSGLAGGPMAAPEGGVRLREVSTLVSMDELKARFVAVQYDFLPVAPPSEDVYWHSDRAVLPVDWDRFPDAFRKGLVPELAARGIPLYRVGIYEDSQTRDTVFVNRFGDEIYRLAPDASYNPYAWQIARFKVPAALAFERWYQWIYDPAHVAAEFNLIPDVLYADYQRLRDEQAAMASPMAPMTMATMPQSVTELQMGIAPPSEGTMQWELAWPAGFSDRVEIFAATDLTARDWSLVRTNIVTAGSSTFLWTDTASPVVSRFYITGNADLDQDGDGLANAREKLLHKTNPALHDTDGDGLNDGWEIGYGGNPLAASAAEALADADQDGFSNLEEQRRGTDPSSPDPQAMAGSVTTLRYYYDSDDRLTDCFVGRTAAEKAEPSPAHNLSETVLVH